MNASISSTPASAQASTIALRLVRRHAPAASRTARACRPAPRRSSTRRGGGSAAGCRRRRCRGRRAAPRTSRRTAGSRAAAADLAGPARLARRDRQDLAARRRRMPGDDLPVAMFAVDRIAPADRAVHREPPSASGLRPRLDTGPRVRVWHRFARKDHKPCESAARHRAAQRNGSPREPERHRPRPPRARPPVPVRPRRGHGPDAQRDPRAGRRARGGGPRHRGAAPCVSGRRAGPPPSSG